MATSNQDNPGSKRIQPYLKIAEDHEKKDIVVTYWCRLYAVQTFLSLDAKSSSAFLYPVMDWLEKAKKENKDNDAITNDVVAQAHVESYALKLFLWADGQDRAGIFNKNVVKTFYTAGLIYDVASIFGEPSEEVAHHKKYAKWKATYIHNSLKNGITPIAGPMAMENEEGFSDFPTVPSFNNPYEPSGSVSQPQVPGSPSDLDPQLPYPVGGIFATDPQSMNLIPSGVHAPPSTPNNSVAPSPPSADNPADLVPVNASGGVKLEPQDFMKAQKYCKWAVSALQYEDVSTAIENLRKALHLLSTGKDE